MANANPMEVEKSLKGIDFPAKKRDLVKHAKQRGADQRILETIQNLPKEDFFTVNGPESPVLLRRG